MRVICALYLAGLGLVTMTALRPAAAQQPAGPGTISGVAFDSIRGHAMSGAQIIVQGTAMLAVADSAGHFRFDRVPSGQYRLLASHPILDSLGISLVSPEITVAPGQSLTVDMATPSAAMLVKQLCPAGWLTRGPAALFGRVRNADTDQPIDKAHVSLVWSELDLSGLRKVPHIRRASTGQDGTYRICGLPATLDGRVQVAFSGLKSGDVPVTLDNALVEVRSLSLASVAPIAVARGDTALAPRRTVAIARLSGTVFSVAGQPVAGARVQLEGTTRTADTHSDGTFTLDSLPSGSQVVIARRIGYNPVEQTVELSSATPATTTLRFDQAVSLLPPVTTEAQRVSGLQAVGFVDRKKIGLGFFLDEKQIANRQSSKITDLLRTIPGLRVQTTGFETQVYDTRTQGSGCVNYVVDGSPWVSMQPGDIDTFLQPQNLGALEFYHGSQTPPQFATPGSTGCATLVIWTKWRVDQSHKRR